MRRLGLILALVAATTVPADGPEQAQIDFADGLFGRGFYAEAAEEYAAYLEQWPAGTHVQDARYRLGESAFATEDFAAALTAFDALLADNPKDLLRARAQLSRAEALYRLGRLEDAGVAFAPLASEGGDLATRPRALYYLLKIRRELGDLSAAAAVYETMRTAFPDDSLLPYAQYQMGFVHSALGDPEKAGAVFAAVAKANADPEVRAESLFRAAESYEAAALYASAVEAYAALQHDFPESDFARRAETGQLWAQYNAGNYAEARDAAKAFIAAHAENEALPGVHFLLANSLQELGDYDAALTHYNTVRSTWPESAYATRAQYKMAWALFLKKDHQAAKTQAEAFLAAGSTGPESASVAYLLATVLAEEGNCEAAQPHFASVAAQDESVFAAEALYRSAECLEQLSLLDAARAGFHAFVEKYPEDPLALQAQLRAADAAFRGQQYAEAISAYTTLLNTALDAQAEEETRYRLAVAQHNAEDYPASAASFLALVEEFPESAYCEEAWFRIAEARLREGGDPSGAITAYQKVLDLAPTGDYVGRARRGLALAHYEAKDFDNAATRFLQLLAEHPEIELNAETYAWTAQYFFDQSRWAEAVTAFEALIAARPDAPETAQVRLLLAQSYEETGRDEDARKQYTEILTRAPESGVATEAGFRLGGIHEAAGESDEAIARYEAAANANVGDIAAQARFRLGALYEAQEDCEKASREYMRIAILFLHDELSPEALLRAARCFEKLDRAPQAKSAYEELIADFPESTQAAAAREALGAAAG